MPRKTKKVTIALAPEITMSCSTKLRSFGRAWMRSTNQMVPASSAPGGFTITSQPAVIPAITNAGLAQDIAQAISTTVPASTALVG